MLLEVFPPAPQLAPLLQISSGSWWQCSPLAGDGSCQGPCPAHAKDPQPHTWGLRAGLAALVARRALAALQQSGWAVRPSQIAPLLENHLEREQLPINLTKG